MLRTKKEHYSMLGIITANAYIIYRVGKYNNIRTLYSLSHNVKYVIPVSF